MPVHADPEPEVKNSASEPPRPLNNPFVRPRGNARPVYKLPFEVLARIFEYCSGFEFGDAYWTDTWWDDVPFSRRFQLLERAAGEEKPDIPEDTRAGAPYEALPCQVILSHVCRLWRDVAISTPTLWTDIKVHLEHARPPFELVSLHLQRSQNLLIDITVNGDAPQLRGTALADGRCLYALLVPHLARWRSLDIGAGDSLHMSAFLDAVSSPSIPPALELTKLELQQFHPRKVQLRYPEVRDKFFTLFNSAAPRLTKLVLLGVYVDWTQPWIYAISNLTTLVLIHHFRWTHFSWAEFSGILRGAPRLQKLTLYDVEPDDPPEQWVDVNVPIPLLQLTELVLGMLQQDVGIGLLRKLSMPSLKSLMIDLSEDLDYSDFVGELAATTYSRTRASAEDTASGSLLSGLETIAILSLRCQSRDEMVTLFDNLENVKTLRVPLDHNPFSYPCQSLLLELLHPVVAGGHTTLERWLGSLRSGLWPSTQGASTVTSPKTVGLRLPRLEHLCIWPSTSNEAHLREVVQQRIDAGIPLKALYVPSDQIGEMDTEGKLWFCNKVETFGSVDEGDVLFPDEAFRGPVLKSQG